jgi:acetyl-CoA carboxylase biotin carboxyl carrier protein
VSRVKALAEALEGSDVSELDLTENGLHILIRRQTDTVMLPSLPVSAPRARANGAPRRKALARRSEAETPAVEPGIAVVAPLTGVFYASPSPASAAFVEVGQPVQAGQVVCIVEAMKVFNEIRSEVSGTVLSITAKNGQLVQKGEALIRVQAS